MVSCFRQEYKLQVFENMLKNDLSPLKTEVSPQFRILHTQELIIGVGMSNVLQWAEDFVRMEG
jgi:hypothetical protein